MQKRWFKSAIAFVLTGMMIFGGGTSQKIQAASETDRYTGGYSIESVLTHFQYFTQGDCFLGNHTVGPVAVGGTLDANITLGEGAHNASYANKLGGTMVPTVTNDGSAYGGTTRDFYYGENNIAGADLTGFTQNASYMDIANNFDGIITESESMVNGAVAPEIKIEEDPYNPSIGNTIICDFTQNTNYVINYNDLYKAKNLKMVIGSVEDFKTQKCVINIVGLNNNDFMFDGTSGTGWKESDIINVFLNSDSSNGVGYLKTMSDAVKPNECNINGMKLIFNFPDATGTIKPNNLGGHIVAPKATVYPTDGNHEGGIIAKTVINYTAEAHYFPYNNPSNGSQASTPNSIILIKTYVDSEGNAVAESELPAEKAKFALYTMKHVVIS